MDRSVTGPTGDLTRLLRRRSALIVAGLMAGAVLVGGAVLARPVSYSSSASVLVTPTGVDDSAAPANGQGTKTGVNLDTEAQLAESIAVAQRAVTLLQTDRTFTDLTAASKVEIPANTQILRISFKARTASGAQRGAQAFATAYLDHRRANAAASLAGQAKSVQQQIASLRGQLQETVTRLSNTASESRDRAFIQAQADVLTSQIAALTDRLSTLQATTVTPGRIIVNAAVPAQPAGLSRTVLMLLGIFCVLVGTLALAVLRDRTDRRLHTAKATERRTGAPVLLDLAGVTAIDPEPTERSPDQPTQEFRRAESTLTAALPTGSRVILVTAASTGSTASLVAANLAGALGRGGSTAVLIRADPTAIEPPGDGPGLAEVLAGDASLGDVLSPLHGTEAAYVLARGHDTGRLTVGLQTPAAGRLIAASRELANWVVIELAPTPTSADAQTLARWADAAVIVVDAGHTRGTEVRAALTQLHEVGLARVGCALVPGWLRGGEPFIPAPARPAPR